jgi:cbb3-type cytochrome oxidase cytochrome c subunit
MQLFSIKSYTYEILLVIFLLFIANIVEIIPLFVLHSLEMR